MLTFQFHDCFEITLSFLRFWGIVIFVSESNSHFDYIALHSTLLGYISGDKSRKVIIEVLIFVLLESNCNIFEMTLRENENVQMHSTFNHISPSGVNKVDLAFNFIGIGVREVVENLKFIKSLINDSFVCMRPNLKAMQVLGPSPNGMKAIEWRFFLFSSENLSGSNLSGSG